MSSADISEQIIDLVIEITGEEEVREYPDADLFEEGILDSLSAIELLVSLEDRFGVHIAPTELEREEMNTLQKIIDRTVERL
ncbi:MAG: D-alanine--poly(phosphoribitol) ligase subunit DltC [Coriobacteriales bacterium]|nr:D-alanine--poly(phosphoribitol) ligase subunit DltC [Coriobacteriales bacterium]